jgi:hypothetical protein
VPHEGNGMTTDTKQAAPTRTDSLLVEVTRADAGSGALVAYSIRATEADGQWAIVACGAISDEHETLRLRKEMLEQLGQAYSEL